MSLLLGIDVGTTATKGVLLDSDSGPIAEAERPSRLISSQPGWAEEDPYAWWQNVCDICRELAPRGEIRAVGVAGMVPCTILLDQHLAPLRWSIQQNDGRAAAEIQELRRLLPPAMVLERTGSAITQQSTAPRLRWLARHEPDVWAQTRWVVGSYDFIGAQLTGQVAVECNWALEGGLYAFRAGCWDSDLVRLAGLSTEVLPPVLRPHDIAGEVTRKAAEATGLAPGTPVVAGCADHIGSTLAVGVLRPGDLLLKLGGAGDVMLVVDEPKVDERLYLDFHLIPGRFVVNGCMATTGSLIRWFQAQIAPDLDLAQLDAEAEAAGPGAGGIVALPYFLGEKTPLQDPRASGALVGLRLDHTRGHLFRAVLEATAFGFRHHLDVLREDGYTITHTRLAEGGARSRVWTQILADVLDLPLEKVTVRSGSALAAAFAAGVGIGVFRDWYEIERFATASAVVQPNPRAVYDRHYSIYRSLYPALQEVLRT